MKKILVLALALVMASVSGVFASDTATVDVSAEVMAGCEFLSNGTVAFGSLYQGTASPNVNGVVTQPTFQCSAGTTYAITDDNGLYETGTTHQMAFGANRIPYSFTYDAGTVAATGGLQSMDIAASVLGADYQGAAVGIYSDTVTLTILP